MATRPPNVIPNKKNEKIVNKIRVLFASSLYQLSVFVAPQVGSAHLEEQFVERYDTLTSSVGFAHAVELKTDLLASVASQVCGGRGDGPPTETLRHRGQAGHESFL